MDQGYSVFSARVEAVRIVSTGVKPGYAISKGELEIGMSAITVPVGNRSGAMGAPVSVSVFSGRVSVATLKEKMLPVFKAVAACLQRAR